MSYLSLPQTPSGSFETQTASDEELLARSLSNEPRVFSEIVARYEDAFVRKAVSILKNEELAIDAVQEAFVKIYIKGSRFKVVEGASFKSWAYKVLINTCLTLYRKEKRRRSYILEELDQDVLLLAHTDSLDERLSLDAFLSVLSRLPQRFASILKQVALLGKTNKEIADSENISIGAVRTRLHRARKAFEKVQVEII